MLKKQAFTIVGTVFPIDLRVSFGESDEEVIDFLKEHNIEDGEGDGYKCIELVGNGVFVMFPNNESLIRCRQVPGTPHEFGTLQHEITHFVYHALERLNVNDYNNEVHAYFTQYITEVIYDRIYEVE